MLRDDGGEKPDYQVRYLMIRKARPLKRSPQKIQWDEPIRVIVSHTKLGIIVLRLCHEQAEDADVMVCSYSSLPFGPNNNG